MINEGYLRLSDTEFPVLRLTEKSGEILYRKAQLSLAKPEKTDISKEAMPAVIHEYEKALFANLKQLRTNIANAEQVAPYLIFSDSTLVDLATYLPLQKTDLEKISGFGSFKMAKYGEPFLHLIQQYCRENHLQTRIHFSKKEKRISRPSTGEKDIRSKSASLELFQQGKSISEIAAERSLTAATIENHLAYFISLGQLDINRLVDRSHQAKIREAAMLKGRLSLKLIKDNCPDELSYMEIKMVLADMEFSEKLPAQSSPAR
jgi:ATP-dependent DNA helicase RecQ